MPEKLPWYQRTYRWGQTNITEIDPARYDIAWWREQWRRTRVQGLIINAGGIVAYYPSAQPLQYRAKALGDRDLFGELTAAAREEGLVVLARMDCNRADERFFQAHPDWFARDKEGQPYRAAERYVSCIFTPYYTEYIPEIIREIIDRYHPEGFADNSWSGLGRDSICYCEFCQRGFREATGHDLPAKADWDSPVYRQWITWNYQQRLEIWDLFNKVTASRGGEDCLYLGMLSGNMVHQARRFRDTKALCERSKIILLDHQHRALDVGFQGNSEAGKLLHGLAGWDILIPESMPMYQGRAPTFRLSAKPAPEARMWMVEGFAGGIQPWWHHISAYHEDRRQYRTAQPVMEWHEANEEYLVDRTPIATVGVIWSGANIDFYGRDDADQRVMQPYWGAIQALIRARIPYVPLHIDHLERHADSLDAIILPNVGALSDGQTAAIRRFVEGGGLLATGESSLYDEWGDRRADFGLAGLLGAHVTGQTQGSVAPTSSDWETYEAHTYLRLHPELRARVDGPQAGNEPPIIGERHAVLQGFDETDILPFGGQLTVVRADQGALVPCTYIPAFPIFPPETSWMRQPDTGIPGLVLNEKPGQGRVAYLPADMDRCFARYNLPDHGDLLANLARWVAVDEIPLHVEGPGLLDCQLYAQPGRLILHVVNLTNPGAWRSPIHELIPVGRLSVRVRLPIDVPGRGIRNLVGQGSSEIEVKDGWASFTIPSVLDHEVVVIS